MEPEKTTLINYRDEDGIDYEISVDLLESSIKFKIKCLDDFLRYEKDCKLKELLEIRPFIIIEDKYEIYQVIIQGLTLENGIRLRRNDSFNLILTFNTFFAKKYTNSFELDMVLTQSLNTEFLMLEVLRQIKKLKVENEKLMKDNEMLKSDNKHFKESIETYKNEINNLKEKFNNISVFDIYYDDYINFENYNFLCNHHFKRRFKHNLIYSQDGTNLNKYDLKVFKNKIKFKNNLLFIISLKIKNAKLLGFYQSIALENDFSNENYYDDSRSVIIEFDTKNIFPANVDKGRQIRTCNGYYLLFGNDGNFNGFYIRDDTSSLPNLYKKTEYFNMQGSSKAGFEFYNSNIEKLNVYMINFN